MGLAFFGFGRERPQRERQEYKEKEKVTTDFQRWTKKMEKGEGKMVVKPSSNSRNV